MNSLENDKCFAYKLLGSSLKISNLSTRVLLRLADYCLSIFRRGTAPQR
jgi:hypothetical protein